MYIHLHHINLFAEAFLVGQSLPTFDHYVDLATGEVELRTTRTM